METFYVREEEALPSRWGKPPSERTVEELLDFGVVIVDKPQGPTSHQVSAWVRDMLGVGKAAHAGTLDPNAHGVLPVALGRAVRLVDMVHLGSKEYVALMVLHADAPEKAVREALREFVGEIYQVPPVKSAVSRRPRVRRVFRIDVLEIEGRYVLFKAVVESGTYIRAICRDVGTLLGTGASLRELRRTRTANMGEEMAVRLQDLLEASYAYRELGNDSLLRGLLHPAELMVEHMKKVIVKDTAVDALAHGADLSVRGIVKVSEGVSRGDWVAVLTLKGELVMVGKALMTSAEMVEEGSGIAVRNERTFMRPGVYPSTWK